VDLNSDVFGLLLETLAADGTPESGQGFSSLYVANKDLHARVKSYAIHDLPLRGQGWQSSRLAGLCASTPALEIIQVAEEVDGQCLCLLSQEDSFDGAKMRAMMKGKRHMDPGKVHTQLGAASLKHVSPSRFASRN